MSIYGGFSSPKNIFNISKNVSIKTNNQSFNVNDIINALNYIYDTIEYLKSFLHDAINKDTYGIIPEYTLMDVKVKMSGGQFIARRIYYSIGYPTIDGKCDCDILEELYNEHPLLQGYDFKLSEPQCCADCC